MYALRLRRVAVPAEEVIRRLPPCADQHTSISLRLMVNRSASSSARSGAVSRAKEAFRRSGGTLRTAQARSLGIHPRTLYELRDTGDIEQIARGLYRLKELPPLGNPDLVAAALKVPRGVVCLLSALALHELTTQVPHEVHLALERGSEPPRLDFPPLRLFWFSGAAFSEGVETHSIDGIAVRVYSAEKTVADCFKYRNKLGIDVAVEALRLYRRRKRARLDELMRLARVCRVERVMRPYIEAAL